MKIQEITIANFRNLNQLNSKIKNKNVLIEQNGTGKTNFLEAIYYSIFGKSFRRVQHSRELIGNNQNFTRIVLDWEKGETSLVINESQVKVTRQFKFNDKLASSRKLILKYPLIIFAPHSVDLVSGEPASRRSDLDDFLSMTTSNYIDWISSYSKVLKNRNALIKNIQSGKSQVKELNYWTQKLVELASLIYEARFKFFNEIGTYVEQVANELYYREEKFFIKYIPNFQAVPDQFSKLLSDKFEENLQKEIIVGKTLYGVHKDDYEFNLRNMNMRFFASRGQQRIASFIFKIAQKKYFENFVKEIPVILIDDIFSELDSSHRKNVSNFLLGIENQVIITGAVENEFPDELINQAQRIRIKN